MEEHDGMESGSVGDRHLSYITLNLRANMCGYVHKYQSYLLYFSLEKERSHGQA